MEDICARVSKFTCSEFKKEGGKKIMHILRRVMKMLGRTEMLRQCLGGKFLGISEKWSQTPSNI